MPVSAGAEIIHYSVDQSDSRLAVVTFDLGDRRLQPILSDDRRSVFISVTQAAFQGGWRGPAGVLESIDQFRNADFTTLQMKFKSPVSVRGEEGVTSQRLIVAGEALPDSSARGGLPFHIVPASIGAPAENMPGITVVIPDFNTMPRSALAMQLRAVAWLADLAVYGMTISEPKKAEDESSELKTLVHQLNIEVVELRNDNMVLEEELRALRAGKKDGTHVRK